MSLAKDWKQCEIGQIATLVNGRGFKPHEWKRHGLPIIRIQNLNGGKDFNYYDGDYDPKLEVETGQLLFAWSGSRGTSFGPHIWRGPKGLLNYHTWKVIPNDSKVDKVFLLYLLRNVTVKVESEAHGASALVHTQKWAMEEYSVLLPPLAEQKKIAEILSTWDRAIDSQSAVSNFLKKRLTALRQEIFGKQNLLEGKYKWDYVSLGELVEPIKSKNKLGCVRVLTASGEHGLVDQTKYFNRNVAGKNLAGYYYLVRGDFAYNRSFMRGYPVGAIKQLTDYDDGIVSTLYLCFRAKPGLDSTYAKHLFESGILNEELGSVVQKGARAHGLLNIAQGEFYSISVPYVDVLHQVAIGRALESVELMILKSDELLALLKKQKQGLMQKLLTGKVRVKV